MKSIRWKRVLGLTGLSLLIIAIAADLLLAWIYMQALTNPGCPNAPSLSNDLTPPLQVELTTFDGRILPAWYYPARNRAAVIALGGMAGALGTDLPRTDILVENEFGVLQIGSRACAAPPGRVTLGFLEAEDALAGLEFLQSQPEIDPDKIGITGFSMGGVAAIRAAAKEPSLTAVMVEGGYANLGDDIVERGRPQPILRRIFLWTVAGVFWVQTGINPFESSPIEDLPLISPSPVQFIYGEFELEAGRAMDQYAAAGEPKDLWIVPGGHHGTNYSVAPINYDNLVLEFFSTHLLHPSP